MHVPEASVKRVDPAFRNVTRRKGKLFVHPTYYRKEILDKFKFKIDINGWCENKQKILCI